METQNTQRMINLWRWGPAFNQRRPGGTWHVQSCCSLWGDANRLHMLISSQGPWVMATVGFLQWCAGLRATACCQRAGLHWGGQAQIDFISYVWKQQSTREKNSRSDGSNPNLPVASLLLHGCRRASDKERKAPTGQDHPYTNTMSYRRSPCLERSTVTWFELSGCLPLLEV